MKKTVAVIGGSGFVGRATVCRLAREGYRVIVLCRNSEKAKFLKPMGDVGQINVVAGNALDENILNNVISSADVVVNLIGILAESRQQTFDQLQGYLPGKIGTIAKKHCLDRVIHVSAIGADKNSLSEYARSKAVGEQALKKAFTESVILRPSIIFGPRDNFFNRFAAMAMIAPALPLPGGGHMLLQPVYVENVAEAIFKVAENGRQPTKRGRVCKIFELGGPGVFSFRQLMELTLYHIERRRALVHIPFPLLNIGAVIGELLPSPPITRDQLKLLRINNVVSRGAFGLSELGITPTSVEAILPTFLNRFRPSGLFSGD